MFSIKQSNFPNTLGVGILKFIILTAKQNSLFNLQGMNFTMISIKNVVKHFII